MNFILKFLFIITFISIIPATIEAGDFDDCVVEQLLGMGGMGIVEQIRDPNNNQRFARKMALTLDGVETLENEFRILKMIEYKDPGITPLRAFDIQNRSLKMTLLEGKDLVQTVNENGNLPKNLFLKYFRSIAGSLVRLHKLGILHRDVKCGNIFITKEGEAVLTDFGIAKFAPGLRLKEKGKFGQTLGTPHFMPPEALTSEGLATVQNDIYGLGMSMYNVLTGKLPFNTNWGIGAYLATKQSIVLPPEIPAEFRPILEKALAFKPEDRYQSMQEFLDALNRVQ